MITPENIHLITHNKKGERVKLEWKDNSGMPILSNGKYWHNTKGEIFEDAKDPDDLDLSPLSSSEPIEPTYDWEQEQAEDNCLLNQKSEVLEVLGIIEQFVIQKRNTIKNGEGWVFIREIEDEIHKLQSTYQPKS